MKKTFDVTFDKDKERFVATEKISIQSEVFNIRMLLFLETEPQSNKYNQILLNPEEFKKVSASFGKPTGKVNRGIEDVELTTSKEMYTLPDLRQIEN